MIREEISKILEKATGQKAKIERPTNESFGDYSTNLAMAISRATGKDFAETAKKITQSLNHSITQSLFSKVEVRQGFINFFLAKERLQKELGEILKKGEKFGVLKAGKNRKVQIEFISANPTGPLTLGNGRGGFCGDTLARVLEMAGYKVEREYYINDVGEQIRKLGHSVIGDKEAVYKGEYIAKLRKRVKAENVNEVGEKSARIILEEMIKPTVKKMAIKFDNWFSEKSLHEKGEIEKILKFLKKNDLAYEKEGAWWFRSTRFGDDKDRVLVKADGEKTYFASDIAYLKDKFKRGFNKLIFFWGADHQGYVKRMQAAVQALGCKKEQAEFIIMQLVHLFEKGKETRMSKREGVYVTLDELISEVGLDVARFFFLQRSPGSHLNFDLSLAKEQSEKNPVYYVQYAYARIASILRKVSSFKFQVSSLKLLNHQTELKLIKQLIRLPEVVEDSAGDFQVQRLPQYALELATTFHQFYTECQVLSSDKDLSEARLALISAVKIVLKNTLDLMGISAPQKM